jgi:hypothetical protein
VTFSAGAALLSVLVIASASDTVLSWQTRSVPVNLDIFPDETLEMLHEALGHAYEEADDRAAKANPDWKEWRDALEELMEKRDLDFEHIVLAGEPQEDEEDGEEREDEDEDGEEDKPKAKGRKKGDDDEEKDEDDDEKPKAKGRKKGDDDEEEDEDDDEKPKAKGRTKDEDEEEDDEKPKKKRK